MDTDELRKYERLSSIQDKFEAYLPFWYFMGHTAKFISEDEENGLQPEERAYFQNLAKSHFEKYDRLNRFNILREDELTASFALEYIDLLLLEENPDKEKIGRLIETAVRMAGNANDILDLCAVSYLKIGKTDAAERLLHNLVNEDYNTETNAKLLSRIYVSEYLRGANPLARTRYRILETRIGPMWLFPMPENKGENPALEDYQLQQQYLSDQKYYLQKEYSDAIASFIRKYIALFNRIIPVPADGAPDEYFLNTEEAVKKRRQDVYNTLNSEKGDEYRALIRESGFRFRYVELINNMLNGLDGLKTFREDRNKEFMILEIRKNLAEVSSDLKVIQEHLNHGNDFSIADYDKLQKNLSFQRITQGFFARLKARIDTKIDQIYSLDKLDDLEYDLTQFCGGQGIPVGYNGANASLNVDNDSGENEYISRNILGRNERDERFSRRAFEKMLMAVKDAADSVITDTGTVKFLIRGETEFDLYFKNVRLSGDAFKSKTLAIVDDRTTADQDLFITCDGVVPVRHDKISGLRDFSRIKYQGKNLDLGWPETYSNKNVSIPDLYALIENLGKIREMKNVN